MPLIVGAPRSGTTLLRFMLDASPELAIPPETGFLSLAGALDDRDALTPDDFVDAVVTYPPEAPGWDDHGIPEAAYREQVRRLDPFTVADGLRTFYAMYAARHGKPRWGDKTPAHALSVAGIAGVLPEARFIHIVRDGRDVAVSLRKRWFSPGDAIEVQADFWLRHVRAAREQGATVPHFLELRYEDLLAEPEAELRRVCAFIDLPFDAAMLRFHERTPERLTEHGERRTPGGELVVSHDARLEQQAMTMQPVDPGRIGTWEQELTPDDAAAFTALAGPMLRAYGYAVPSRFRARGLRAGRA